VTETGYEILTQSAGTPAPPEFIVPPATIPQAISA